MYIYDQKHFIRKNLLLDMVNYFWLSKGNIKIKYNDCSVFIPDHIKIKMTHSTKSN